jgi:hypothetical protein
VAASRCWARFFGLCDKLTHQHNPVVCCCDVCLQVIDGCCDMSEPVPFNIDQPVSVDTDLFQGFVSLQIR